MHFITDLVNAPGLHPVFSAQTLFSALGTGCKDLCLLCSSVLIKWKGCKASPIYVKAGMKKLVQKNRKGTEEGVALCHRESSLPQGLSGRSQWRRKQYL